MSNKMVNEGIEVCGLDYNELVDMIASVYRKYRNGIEDIKDVNLSFEDMVQEGLLRVWECQPSNMALARTIVRNWFIDKMRSSHRRAGRLNDAYKGIESTGNVGSSSYEDMDESIPHPKMGRDYNESFDLFERLDQIKDPRERRFAVAKGYLCGGLEALEPEFKKMVSELDEESLALFESSEKDTDDMIYKVFCGIKSGVNAGSSRVLRGGLKRALLAEG